MTKRFQLDSMFPLDLATAGETARNLELQGFDGVWTTETPNDPYLPLVAVALATERVLLGTGVATAFTRSPMVTALSAWNLQKLSKGRFLLGLGSQVKAHNARRYSTPVDRPAAQLRELVEVIRHIWGAFQGEHPLNFIGDFYTFDLFAPMHSPGPIEHPDIPIYLSAVGPLMYQLAGEVADGVHVHSFNTPDYLRETALPQLEKGLQIAGRERSSIELVSALFAVIGGDSVMDRAVRSQIAFYGSTSSYRPIFELHGRAELTDQLKPLARNGDVDGMIKLVDDDLVDLFAIVADSWSDAATIVEHRYGGILNRVGFYGLEGMVDPSEGPAIVNAFGSG